MKTSAGILLYRKREGQLEFFLVHPGGPYWQHKDLESWSIPKGEFTDGENPLDAAKREFEEETGIRVNGDFVELLPVKIKSGKTIYAWALEQDCEAAAVTSNTFSMEWPPKSGILKSFPEVDRAEWFSIDAALERINSGQRSFITQLSEIN